MMKTTWAVLVVVLCAPGASSAQFLPPAPAERCTWNADPQPAGPWLDKALKVIPPQAGVLRFRASHDVPLWEQSDRPFEPFVPNTVLFETAYDHASGVIARAPVLQGPRVWIVVSGDDVFMKRDTLVRAVPVFAAALPLSVNLLNPWEVLRQWVADSARVQVAGRCLERNHSRVVLERDSERLYLSASDGVPTKLTRTEPHYLWGSVPTDYLWHTWWGIRGGGLYPVASFRVVEGYVYERLGVDVSSLRLVQRDSVPELRIPSTTSAAAVVDADAEPVDTTRVAESVFLLSSRSYTHAVARVADTVFVLDASTSERRSRADSVWIARLFPGARHFTVVVTDVAWPHVAGVRYWVSRGARLVVHPSHETFLRSVVERRWTQSPDVLERNRGSDARIIGVVDSLVLGGGKLVAYPLTGTVAEGALNVWVSDAAFVWAGDYLQRSPQSPYRSAVISTALRRGLSPRHAAGQHFALQTWARLIQQ